MILFLTQFWVLFVIGLPTIIFLAIVGIVCCLITVRDRNREIKQLEEKLDPPETFRNITIVLPLDSYNEQDIIAYLKHVPDKHSYLKMLIRDDIARRYKNQNANRH